MTQNKSANVNLSNSQLNTLKLETKNSTEIALRLSANVVGNSNYEYNFPHKLLLAVTEVPRHRKAVSSNKSDDIELAKAEISKIIQLGGFLGLECCIQNKNSSSKKR